MKMYYITATEYVGPNQDQAKYVDADTIEISTEPARNNMNRAVRVYGWCGTTNDIKTYAHGEYYTLDDAKTAITDIFGDVRDCDSNNYPFETDDDSVVAVYKPGKYTPMSEEATAHWIDCSMQGDVTATTSDERIVELAAGYEADANLEGYTLYGAEEMMEQYRQELIEETEA